MLKRFALVLLFALSSTPLGAEVVRIEVNSRADILPEKSFGSVGGFEKFVGKIYFAVDPRNTANQIITDIDKAPQNSSGKVEFSSDFYMKTFNTYVDHIAHTPLNDQFKAEAWQPKRKIA